VAERLRVGVIFGGRSGEHEVSIASAAAIFKHLDPSRYEAVPIRIDKQGRWQLTTSVPTALSAADVIKQGPSEALAPIEPSAVVSRGLDVIFPVLHGPYGEDGTVQGLLDLAGDEVLQEVAVVAGDLDDEAPRREAEAVHDHVAVGVAVGEPGVGVRREVGVIGTEYRVGQRHVGELDEPAGVAEVDVERVARLRSGELRLAEEGVGERRLAQLEEGRRQPGAARAARAHGAAPSEAP
jgi:hypothetical protein